MIKITLSYSAEEEKDNIISNMTKGYKVAKISKEYCTGPYKRIYIDLINNK